MSVASLLGLDKIGDQSVKDAQQTVAVSVEKVSPLFRDIENRFGGILHGLLDRFEIDFSFKFKLNPVPKAEAVPPDQQ